MASLICMGVWLILVPSCIDYVLSSADFKRAYLSEAWQPTLSALYFSILPLCLGVIRQKTHPLSIYCRD